MAHPKPKKPRSPKSSPGSRTGRLGSESRPVEVLTIAWMLTVMTTLLCEFGWLAVTWLVRAQPEPMAQLEVLGGMLLFAALVLGLLSLAMLPFVWRMRRVPPPPGVTVFAVVVAVIPLLVMFTRVVR